MRPLLWLRRHCRLGSLRMNTCVAIILYVVLLAACANYITASVSSAKGETNHKFRRPSPDVKKGTHEEIGRRRRVDGNDNEDAANRRANRLDDEEDDRERRLMQRRVKHDQEVFINAGKDGDGGHVRDVQNRRRTAAPTVRTSTKAKTTTRSPTAGGYVAKERIVHFDLKGAPPKIEYLLQIIPLIAKAGATGVLMEWEDTFPYKNEVLARGVRGNPYSMEEVHSILGAAKANNLTIIPLVQTFGHLEWLLKVEGNEMYRDNPINSQVICAAQEDAYELLKTMIDEIAEVHKRYGMTHIHIGCDEVYEVGTCAAARAKLSSLGGKDQYMVWHMSRLASYIRDEHSTRTQIWHDMIVNMDIASLAEKYNFTSLVEPVIWMYAENLDMYLQPYVWDVFADFEHVWGSSAYKGADGPMRYHSNVNHYVRNHHSWVDQMTTNAHRMKNFRGIMTAGWSRYDHFAILAELLPVAVPSLLMSLQVLKRGIPQLTDESTDQQFADLVPLVHCDMDPSWNSDDPGSGCTFPGESIYQQIQHLRNARDQLRETIWSDIDPGFDYNGWLGIMNVKHIYSSHYRTAQLLPMVQEHLSTFKSIHDSLKSLLSEIYSDDVVTEWIYEYVWPDYGRLIEVDRAGRKSHSIKTFEKRPLNYDAEKSEMSRMIGGNDEL